MYNRAGWAPVLGFAALTLGPLGLATRALRAHPQNWIQTNLAPRGETRPVGLIESFGIGDPHQTPGRLRRTNVAGGSAPRPPLGLRPKPRLGEGLGREPPAGFRAVPPSTFLRQSRPGVNRRVPPVPPPGYATGTYSVDSRRPPAWVRMPVCRSLGNTGLQPSNEPCPHSLHQILF